MPVTIPTPTVPIARIGSDAAELLAPVPSLTLVREIPAERINLRWIPVVCSALVIGASFFAAAPLTESLTGKAAAGALLKLSLAYKALAPICDSLDTISLFSQGQHLAFLITFALTFVAWRVIRQRRNSTVLRNELVAAAQALAVLVGIYLVGAMLPRPTAKLTMSSPDAVVIDFHSHTRYSWDGLSAFSPEVSRRWHHSSGFDAAYITDHSTFAGAEEAALENPARAGDGTTLLSGIEVRDRGNHLVVLGTDERDWQSYTAGDLQERIFQQESEARGSTRPVVLFTLPGHLKAESAMSIDGLELSDAAPRGLTQSDGLREEIVGLAHEQKKSLVASSNNHGWASASPAWSVMQIPGWRAMTPAQLDIAIRHRIIRDGWNAVQVIDRRQPGPVSFVGLALTVPDAAGHMLLTMSWPERVSWLIWIWAVYAIVLLARRIRGDKLAPTQQQSEIGVIPRWRRAAPIA